MHKVGFKKYHTVVNATFHFPAELWSERIMLYYVEAGPGAWLDPFFIKSVVLDTEQGVPFECQLVDLNQDGE